MKLFHFSVAAFLLLFGVPITWACSCRGPRPACSVYATTDSLFVGQVMEIVDQEKPPEAPNSFSFSARLARFRVQESFRGATGSIVEISTGMGGGDCGYPFKLGETYLVYASTLKNGKLYTGICLRTRALENAADDLAFLRALPNLPPGGTIFGKVTLRGESGQTERDMPMPSTQVDISGPTTAKALTDAQGSYSFGSLPPCKYEVNFRLPQSYFSESFNVSVADRTCSEVNAHPSPAGEISGRVLDSNGNPVANLMVDLRDDSKPRASWEEPQFDFTHTDHDGHYQFQGLIPGTYMPGVNINFVPEHIAPYARTYYPGLKDDTQPIHLDLGQRFAHAYIQLPPKLVEREIPVTVIWPNGRKAKEAKIYAIDSLNIDFPISPQLSESHPDAIMLFEGQRYYVRAFMNFRNPNRKCSEIVEVSPSKSTEPVKLVLDQEGDQCSGPIIANRR